MTDDDDLKEQRRSRQIHADNADASTESQGAVWLRQMLPRFALIIQNQTAAGVQVVASHYGVGLPSGQVVLFTVGLSTIAILPSWDQVHQLVDLGQGRMVLVMEESEVHLEADTVA